MFIKKKIRKTIFQLKLDKILNINKILNRFFR